MSTHTNTADRLPLAADQKTTERIEQEGRVARLEAMSRMLDSRFRVPIVNIPVGWDAILGLIPGLGALVTLGPGLAMIWETRRMGGRKRAMARMASNTLLDMALGTVPVVGDLFDVFFKSHRRNAALLRQEHARITDKSTVPHTHQGAAPEPS